ncbi:MAG: zf-HC2 domain-containing protein [Clostridia bacterium]|nr:zf-HC2 domain-containing protein [Clostridia bacterium]
MSNNCSVIRDLIAMYADRETSPQTSKIIAKHLEECPECREYYEHTNNVVRSMKQPPRGNHYRYSALARQIRQRNAIIVSAGCTAFFTLGVIAAKLMSSDR